MKRRLLVTGCGGFVAGSVVRQANGAWDVTALSRRDVAGIREGVRGLSFDLRGAERLVEVFGECEPDAVIHTAAIADIDYCESHREEAEEINVGVTRRLDAALVRRGR